MEFVVICLGGAFWDSTCVDSGEVEREEAEDRADGGGPAVN
eukprot:CAMPEP_0202958200 /NCGR_PEP_ID=MMETSP1396-20130829/2558_1 /ASSEMBLY_ACC=CAM_ASM_000872 /TAXON_ID= /ORGANISM="Pseudokeronopsis sp., Strain Brazil" /LENGTH=40 /DNA_ID= /DNA_START= /DNA_END= /DNA_ORIENTATION=